MTEVSGNLLNPVISVNLLTNPSCWDTIEWAV